MVPAHRVFCSLGRKMVWCNGALAVWAFRDNCRVSGPRTGPTGRAMLSDRAMVAPFTIFAIVAAVR